MDFEAAMSQVQAISGTTGSEVTKLTNKAKEMGATTKFTAEESAEAFNYMARSTARIVTLHVFPAKLLIPFPSVDKNGVILSFASSIISYFSFAQLARLFSVFVIEYSLKAGEKDRILEAIDKLSGYESNNLEEVAKN